MKEKLGLILAMLALDVFSSQALWIGINENAAIGDNGLTVSSWVDSVSDIDSVTFRIKIGDRVLGESFTGYEIWWLGLDDDEEGSGYWYPKWHQVRLPDDSSSEDVVTYEIGISDWDDSIVEDGDYVWVSTIGTANSTLGELIAAHHVYDIGTLNPPNEDGWRPDYYHAPVPEPSSVCLFAFGICVFLLKRNWIKS